MKAVNDRSWEAKLSAKREKEHERDRERDDDKDREKAKDATEEAVSAETLQSIRLIKQQEEALEKAHLSHRFPHSLLTRSLIGHLLAPEIRIQSIQAGDVLRRK